MTRDRLRAPPGKRPERLRDLLKSDAGRLRADVSPELDRRIAAALARVESPVALPATRTLPRRPWLAGSLVGVATAGLVMLLVRPVVDDTPAPAATPASSTAGVTPEYLRLLREQVPLRAETAELTAPLEEELRDLKSDIEKARKHLERDLGLAF